MDYSTTNTVYQQGIPNIVHPEINIYQVDMNTCLFYSRLNQFWMQMTQKRKRQVDDSMSSISRKKTMLTKINNFEQSLDDLFYVWSSINVVLQSIQTSFGSKRDLSVAHLEEVDRELSIAYDDLNTQVRHLERKIKRMTADIKTQLCDQVVSRNPKQL